MQSGICGFAHPQTTKNRTICKTLFKSFIRLDTRGQTPRNDLFTGPLRLRAAAAVRTRTGTDPSCATLLTADLDVIRMFTSLSAAHYTKSLFICGRFLHPRFFRTEISFQQTTRISTCKRKVKTDILADKITVRTKWGLSPPNSGLSPPTSWAYFLDRIYRILKRLESRRETTGKRPGTVPAGRRPTGAREVCADPT